MVKAISLTLFIVCFVSGTSSALYFSSEVFYNPLITWENCAAKIPAKSLVVQGGLTFYRESGEQSGRFFQIPLEFSFIGPRWFTASFLLPLQINTPAEEPSRFGISKPWIKAKFSPRLTKNLSLGARFGLRLPIESSNPGVTVKPLALDLALLAHNVYKSHLLFDAQLGMTLEFASENYKNPSPLYFIAQPGYILNSKITIQGILGSSVPITKGKRSSGSEYTGYKETWAGEKLRWQVSSAIAVQQIFSYRLGDKNAGKDFFLGFNLTGSIPLVK
jgi:hypothetical protein